MSPVLEENPGDRVLCTGCPRHRWACMTFLKVFFAGSKQPRGETLNNYINMNTGGSEQVLH